MDAAAILALVNAASNALASASTLIPEIEQNIAQAKAAMSESDGAKVQAQIDQLHADTQALTAKLNALKDN